MAPRVVRFLKRPLVITATALSLVGALAYPRTFVGAFLVTWLVVYGVGSLARRASWRFTYPAIPPWSKPSARRLGSRMLREGLNAHIFFHRKGFLFKKRYWFVGIGSPMQMPANGERTWWWFADRFYWESQGYSTKDVMALGGATTVEILQLLCSACNREKSDSL
jgi:hypothetical protein